jgi:hypothetical protein
VLNTQHAGIRMKPSLFSNANLLFPCQFITPPTGLNMKLNSEVSQKNKALPKHVGVSI